MTDVCLAICHTPLTHSPCDMYRAQLVPVASPLMTLHQNTAPLHRPTTPRCRTLVVSGVLWCYVTVPWGPWPTTCHHPRHQTAVVPVITARQRQVSISRRTFGTTTHTPPHRARVEEDQTAKTKHGGRRTRNMRWGAVMRREQRKCRWGHYVYFVCALGFRINQLHFMLLDRIVSKVQ